MIHKRTMMNWTTSLPALRQDTEGAQVVLIPPALSPATSEEIQELVMVVTAITHTLPKGEAMNRAVYIESLRKTNSTITINLPLHRERHTRGAMAWVRIDQKQFQTPGYLVRTTHSSTFRRTLLGILPETRTRTKDPT